MTNWSNYEVFDPGVAGPMHTLTRAEARRAHEHLMESKTERIAILRRFLHDNGVVLDSTDSALQDLNEWFLKHVQEDPEIPGRLLPEWYSVINDVALFLGETAIERYPKLHWEFFHWGAKNVSYQRHVIMGFSGVSNPRYNVDIDLVVANYAYQIIARQNVDEEFFVKLLASLEEDV